MIANNKQLARMIRNKPSSREALSKVEGIGEAKIAKYGDQILEILSKHLTGTSTQAAGHSKGSKT